MGKLTVLKLGGSIITKKGAAEPTLDRENLARIASEVGAGYRAGKGRLIIVHGAGSYGHPIVKRYGISKGCSTPEHAFGFAETQKYQNELNCLVVEALLAEGVPAMPTQPSSMAVMETRPWKVKVGGREHEIQIHELISMPLQALEGFLRLGMVPVLFGVPAYDRVQGCSILSGDQIAPYLARELGGRRIVEATDVEGLYTGDPRKDPGAKLIKEASSLEEVFGYLGASSNTDVTGGIRGKVLELFRILGGSGVRAEFISGNVAGNIEAALEGKEGLGTILRL